MTGASGSSASRKSCQTSLPFRLPKRFCAASSAWAEPSSSPPPTPRIAPSTMPLKTVSAGSKFWAPSGFPSAAYSTGILFGSSLASSMYWLMPATKLWMSFWTILPSSPNSVGSALNCWRTSSRR